MRSWFEMPDLVMLVAEIEGRIVGYADLTDQAEEHLRFWIDLRVPPGEHGQEIGAALLEAMEVRAAQMAVPGASVRVSVPSAYDLGRRLAESLGYGPFRYSFQMRIDFDGELPEPEWPQGVSVRRHRTTRSPITSSTRAGRTRTGGAGRSRSRSIPRSGWSRRTGLRSPACVSAEPRGVPAPRWGG
jgi:GNAT superfamily N-acetyltransferase